MKGVYLLLLAAGLFLAGCVGSASGANATPYPYVNASTVSSLKGMLQYGNSVVSNTLGLGLVILVWLVFFLASGNVPFDKRLLGTTTISFVASLPLAALGLISPDGVIILLVITAMVWALVKW